MKTYKTIFRIDETMMPYAYSFLHCKKYYVYVPDILILSSIYIFYHKKNQINNVIIKYSILYIIPLIISSTLNINSAFF